MAIYKLCTNAVSALYASDKVFYEMEVLYATIERLEAKLISKFDSMYVQQLNAHEGIQPYTVCAPVSQTFSSLFSKTQSCIYRINRMLDYVNNCEN